MPTYDSVVSRANAQATIPEQVTASIFAAMPGRSVVLDSALRLPNATRGQLRVPIWQTLPTAYFVNGDTGLKQTSGFSWTNVYANIEELAVIIPIPEAVLEDSAYDIFGEAQPQIVEAFGAALDAAVIHGTNKPTAWDFSAIVDGATAAGHTVDLSSVEGAAGDLYDAVLGPNGVMSFVENDGLMVNGHVAALSMQSRFRGLRGTDGHPIFVPDQTMDGQAAGRLAGAPLYYPINGGLDPASALLISGDWKKLAVTMRQELRYKILTEATIMNGSGTPIYNLAQQDMVALRITMRLGVAIANPPNRVNSNSATRYPWAVLVP